MTAVFDVILDIGGSDGSPGTSPTVTNLRFRTDDANTQDSTNPIPIVAATTKRSYWRQIYLEATTAPTTKVDNVKWYTDGSAFGTGVTLKAGDQVPTKTSVSDAGYEVATGTPGDTGDEMVAAHAGLTSSSDAHATYTSGSALTVTIGEASAQIDAIGETTHYVVLQLEVIDTASPGTLSADTFTFQYDEI